MCKFVALSDYSDRRRAHNIGSRRFKTLLVTPLNDPSNYRQTRAPCCVQPWFIKTPWICIQHRIAAVALHNKPVNLTRTHVTQHDGLLTNMISYCHMLHTRTGHGFQQPHFYTITPRVWHIPRATPRSFLHGLIDEYHSG